MKLVLWMILFLFSFFLPAAHSDSGGVAGDINFDDKIGLAEAIYALQVVAGVKSGERILDPFEVYRADVIRGLKRLEIRQAHYQAENNYYADSINEILSSPLWPDINFSIEEAKPDYFKIKATHNKVSGYYWTYDSGLNFEENGNAFKPEMEVFELYREQIICKLVQIANVQKAYKAEFDRYQTDSSITEFSPDHYPDVILIIIHADENSFEVQGSHNKIKGYVWQINEADQIQTVIISE